MPILVLIGRIPYHGATVYPVIRRGVGVSFSLEVDNLGPTCEGEWYFSCYFPLDILTVGYMAPHQLKRIRQDLGLTQAELAKKVRTTLTTIGRYECGDRRIPDMLGVALASLMNSRYIPMAGVVQAGKPVEPFPSPHGCL